MRKFLSPPHTIVEVKKMYPNLYLCLSDLLDQDLSSYEYFHSLSDDLQKEIEKRDFCSFADMQHYVAEAKRNHRGNATL